LETSEASRQFYEVVWPHRADILRAALIQTGNHTEADDLAQETFLKAYRAMETFRPETNAKAWLLTILRNTRIDRLRTLAGSVRHLSLEELPSDPADEDSGQEAELNLGWQSTEEALSAFSDEVVIEALRELPEEMRWTLVLVDVEGMDHAGASEILGVPVGTIKSRVHRGHALLRRALLPIARQWRMVRD
jgi:RNA polymerase sigma-70 factor (ECF subfamily)